MKNIVIGWILFFSGSALLSASLWILSDSQSVDSKSGQVAAKTVNTASGIDAPVAPDPTQANLPMEPAVATPDPVAVMSAPDPQPTVDATQNTPPRPPDPVDGMTTEPAAALTEVLLVFDARSQHISKQVKDEITNLAKGHPDASFKMEIAAGEMGTPDGNEKLGKKRARAIRKVLMDAGIPERKVSYKVIQPGPADGEGEQSTRQWRKATVRVAGGGK